ncbi:MAG: sigma-70 family RNA polymerase sigma factor [Terriglobia bacterium]
MGESTPQLPGVPQRDEGRAADLDLIRRVAAGDESALAALYDRYSGVVYSVANRVLRDTGAAEEVLQDIFYQLWGTAASFDAARGGLGGWLLVSARNRAIDRLRRRKPVDTAMTDAVIPASFNLESSLAQSELIAKIRATFDILPPSQRQAVELAYFEGMTHSEIAQRTGEPLGTVKSRLRSALQSLRQVLKP